MRRDERGNLLVVAGVVLVMGFVVLAGALSQLSSMDGSTSRAQRDGVVLDVEALMESLRDSLWESSLKGQTNVTDFQAIMRNVERGVIDNAARSGMYLALVPTTDDPETWRRADRCLGYNSWATAEGVVVGFAEDDFEETIAGVVYLVHGTDGGQSIRFLFYAKLEDCADVEITSFHDLVVLALGAAADPQAMKTPPGHASFWETRDEENLVKVKVHPTIDTSTITILGNWNHPFRMAELNGQYTTMPSNLASFTAGNHLRFRLNPPALMNPGDTIPEIKLSVTGYKDLNWNLLAPQSLYLRIYPQGSLVPTVTREFMLPTGASNSATITHTVTSLDLLLGSGWSYEDITTSLWELTVIGLHQASQKWNIDHFNMSGELVVAPYRLDVSFDWQAIPLAYSDHTMEMTYRIPEPMSAGEKFQLLFLDPFTSQWVELAELGYTGGDWQTFTTGLVGPTQTGAGQPPWKPTFRIVDTRLDDYRVPEDGDRIEISFWRIISHLEN